MSRGFKNLKFSKFKSQSLFNGYACEKCGRIIDVKLKYQYLIVLLHFLCISLALLMVALFGGTRMYFWNAICISIVWIGGHLGIHYLSYRIYLKTINEHERIEHENSKI